MLALKKELLTSIQDIISSFGCLKSGLSCVGFRCKANTLVVSMLYIIQEVVDQQIA